MSQTTETKDEPVSIETPTTSGPLCRVCNLPIPYAGTGRRPLQHPECRKQRPDRAPRGVPAGGTAPAKQVDAAVGNLAQLYGLIGMGLMLAGAHQAASMLAAEQDRLAELNREFLARDPQLVAMLTKGAAQTGRAGFIITNGMVVVPVVKVAAQEIALAMASRRARGGAQE